MFRPRNLFFIFSISCSAVLSSCGIPVGPATKTELATAAEASCAFVQNSYGQRVSWKQSLPVLFYIDSKFSDDEEKAMINAAKKWEAIVGHPLATFQRVAGDIGAPAVDSRNTIYSLSVWPSEQGSQQAVTNLYWSNNRITEADIKVNEKYFTYFFDQPENYAVHFESLMIHELGHALGLIHNSITPTVMWPVLALGQVRDSISAKDQGNIQCEY